LPCAARAPQIGVADERAVEEREERAAAVARQLRVALDDIVHVERGTMTHERGVGRIVVTARQFGGVRADFVGGWLECGEAPRGSRPIDPITH
jgi:hypothetical protein